MQNKVMHIYEFQLENGTTLKYKTEGIFSNITGKEEDRVLIKTANWLESYFEDEQGNRVEPVVEGQVVESEQVQE